jgi:Tfp pilus assembly PilM family ATPase
MAKSFFDFFPAPRFLEMPAPGLSITDAGIRLIEFKKDHGGIALKQFGEAILPKGTIVSGSIKDSQTLIKILEDFRKKHDIKYVRTMLPEERAYLFRTKIQNIPNRNIHTSVEFSIEENVPISVADAVFDYSIIGKAEGEDLEEDEVVDIFVSVIPQEVVSEYLDIFQTAGFTPLHFEIESQAVSKAVIPKGENRPMLVINLGKERVGLYVVSSEAVAFTSTVPITLPDENRVVSSDIKYVSENKEEELASSNVVSEFVGLNNAVEEIKKIFLYWQTQSNTDGKPIEQIQAAYICGDEGGRHGIAEYFSQKINIPVNLSNVWVNVFSFHNYVPDITLEKSLNFAGAIGLAISHLVKNK